MTDTNTHSATDDETLHETAPRVREMRLEDIAPVFHLGETLFTADRWPTLYRTWDEYELVALYGSAGATCLVAEVEEQVAGFALGTLLEKRRSPWTYGYLLWLGVDPRFGRRGLGRSLIEELTGRFIEQGARMMLVDTDAENEQALALFRRVGFNQERPHVFLSQNLTTRPDYQRIKGG